MQCTNNLKQITLALHNYADTYREVLPMDMSNHAQFRNWRSETFSHKVALIPYLQRTGEYDRALKIGLRGSVYDPAEGGWVARREGETGEVRQTSAVSSN